jgi:hypothetical protein
MVIFLKGVLPLVNHVGHLGFRCVGTSTCSHKGEEGFFLFHVGSEIAATGHPVNYPKAQLHFLANI